MRVALTIVFCVSFVAGCEDSGSSNKELADTWKNAGLTVSEAEPFEAAGLEGKCGKRLIEGVTAILCEFATADDAKNARLAGLKVVGEHTGAALASGDKLLVVVDRDNKDPSGRTINALTKSFLGKVGAAPVASAKAVDGAAGSADSEGAVGGGLDSLLKKVSD